MNGAQAIIKFLQEKNVEHVFGIPGGPIIVLYDAIYEANFPHILTRHEQGASHAAEGYAKSTGKVGVMIATSGPGATNLVTGIADAYLDSVPVLAITGTVNRDSIGSDAFQEADINGVVQQITKYNYLVMEPEDLLPSLEEAWNLTTEGRPGPVLVNVPKDILAGPIDENGSADMGRYKRHRPAKKLTRDYKDQILESLAAARKPILLIGGGCAISDGTDQYLKEFLDKTNMPLTYTMMAKGVLDDNHSSNLGMVGMHGTPPANVAIGRADLVLAVGTRFSDRLVGSPASFNKKQRTVIHVDVDAAEIGKLISATIPVEDDSREFFKRIVAAMEEKNFSIGDRWKTWTDDLYGRMAKYKKVMQDMYDVEKGFTPQYIIHQVSQAYKGQDPILVTDVGQHQVFATQHFELESNRSFITSGGLGTMGFGLPAAIGAAVAHHDRPTILFAGDGGFQMTLQELGVITKLQNNIKIFLMDNASLGMVRQWQELFFNERYSHTDLDMNPDFVAIAKAYGIRGKRVFNAEELAEAMEEAMSFDGPYMVHCMLEGNENVYPIIPPGKENDEMLYPWDDD